jgi:predicted transcriptional regulator
MARATFTKPKKTGKAANTVAHDLIALSYQSTLAEAYLLMAEQRCGAVYIFQKEKDNLIGLISFAQIRRYLLEGNTSQ